MFAVNATNAVASVLPISPESTLSMVFTTGLLNEFIDTHMRLANPTFSVIYIHGYRQFSKGEKTICCDHTAEAFNILASDVLKAWEYWENAGLVEITSRSGSLLSLNFFNGTAATPAKTPKTQSAPVVRDFPQYSTADIERHMLDTEVCRLFYIAEHLTGKLLTDVERRMYLGFYDDLGLTVDVIEVLLDYCVSKNKKHNNYLRTVAYDWAERGISSVESAEEYIGLFNNEYREILRYFGISGRDPIEKEIEFMHKWLKEDGWPLAVIQKACEKTVLNKGNPNFAYTDGIFKKWKADGVHTIKQIEALDKEYYEGIKSTRKSRAAGKSTKNKTKNYKGRSWDYEKLAEMEKAYLDKKIAE